MINSPIQIEELLERVSGNREFVIRMLDLFFQTSDEKIATLNQAFENRNYSELAEQAHKLKGLVGNLSINKALDILRDLHLVAGIKNDAEIGRLLGLLEEAISEARSFYQNDPFKIR
jgi:hypothetical protein